MKLTGIGFSSCLCFVVLYFFSSFFFCGTGHLAFRLTIEVSVEDT